MLSPAWPGQGGGCVSPEGEQRGSNRAIRGKFLSDVAFRFAAQAMGALKGLIFLPLIARSFGETAYGVWSQIALSVALLLPLLTLRMESALVRYLTECPEGPQRRQAAWTANCIVYGIGAVTLILALSFRTAFSVALFGSSEWSHFILPFAILLFAQALLSMSIAFYRAVGQLKMSTVLQATTSLGAILIVSLSVLLRGASLLEAVIAWTASTTLGAVIGQIGIARSQGISLRISAGTLRKFLRYSLPLIPAMAAVWIIEYSDRFFVVHFLGLQEAGIYTGAYRLAQVMRMLMASMAFVLLPTILQLRRDGSDQLGQLLVGAVHATYLFVGCGAAVFLIGWGPRLLVLLGSESFHVSQALLALLVLGEMLLALRLLYTQLLYLSERTLAVMFIVSGTAAMNLIANLLLVPSLGILGAAIATFASYGAQWLLTVRFVSNRDLLCIPSAVLIRLAVGGCAAYVTLQITYRSGVLLSLGGVLLAALLYLSILWSSSTVRTYARRLAGFGH